MFLLKCCFVISILFRKIELEITMLDGAFSPLKSNCGQDQPLRGLDGLLKLDLALGQRWIDLNDVQTSETASGVDLLKQGQPFSEGHASGHYNVFCITLELLSK